MTAYIEDSTENPPELRAKHPLRASTPRAFWEPSDAFKSKMAARNRRAGQQDEDDLEELWDNVPV